MERTRAGTGDLGYRAGQFAPALRVQPDRIPHPVFSFSSSMSRPWPSRAHDLHNNERISELKQSSMWVSVRMYLAGCSCRVVLYVVYARTTKL
jgi:hypothetical protein